MRDLASFRETVEHYRKQVGRTEEDLARELYLSKGELNKRLHDYSHPKSGRVWRLLPQHVKAIVETLAKWGAITARKQAFALFTLMDFSTVAEEIDWQATPWNKLHVDASSAASPESSIPVRRRFFQVRDLPKGYIPRPRPFNEIKQLLLANADQQPTAITTAALRGTGGFGKTTLASAICHDAEVSAAFPDGILWMELGEHPPRPLAVLNEMLHVLDPSSKEALTLEEARERWQNVLKEHTYLLVIDDVWQTEALEELLKGGPRCRRLITTRNDQVLPYDAKRVWVDAMERAEAMALLCEGVIDEWQHTLDQSVLEQVVLEQLGCWPLLVSLARGMLKNQMRLKKTPEQALALLKHAYEERGMATFHLGDQIERQRNVDACLEVSLRQLEEWVPAHYQARQRYQEIAVFSEDTDVPLTTLQTYWQETGELQSWEVEDLCLRLSDLSLLLPWNAEQETIRLHDVMRSYLIQRTREQLPELHQRLLDAHRQHYHLTRWADLPESEVYIWQYLVSHLCQAGLKEALQDTLTDLNYLSRKALLVGISALEADLLQAFVYEQADPVKDVPLLFAFFHRTIGQISHLLRRVHTEADMSGLLQSYLEADTSLAARKHIQEQTLPRPFLTAWHPLPKGWSSALLRTLYGHAGSINSCGASFDGQWIISASADQTLKIWNFITGEERQTIRGHIGGVTSCAVSPDGQWIVSASADQTLRVWNVATGEERCTLKGHTGGVTSCAVSPNGQWIVSASADQTLKVWNVVTGEEFFTVADHNGDILDCAFSPDGKWVVSASADQTLKVWDAITGEERLTLIGHTDSVTSCAVSPNGQWIVSASADRTLKVWNATTGEEQRTFSGHTHSIFGCVVSPNGQWIVSASADRTLKVWNATTGEEQFTLTGHTHPVRACAFSPDGRFIVSASDDRTLKIWDATTKKESFSLNDHTSQAVSCAVSSNGSYIVSASPDKTLKVWDAATGAKRFTLFSHTSGVTSCAVSPNGQWIVSASADRTLKVWDVATRTKRRTLKGHTDNVTSCAVSPNGQWIVSASADRTLKVWDATTGEERLTLIGHTDNVTSCAVSPNGQWIVSASADRTLKVWDATTGEEQFTLIGHADVVTACIFNPNEQGIVSASADHTLKGWNATTGEEQFTLTGHTDSVTSCAVSSESRFLASVSSDQTLKVWDLQTSQCLLSFPVDGELDGCAFHPDEEHLVACGVQGIYFLRLVV